MRWLTDLKIRLGVHPCASGHEWGEPIVQPNEQRSYTIGFDGITFVRGDRYFYDCRRCHHTKIEWGDTETHTLTVDAIAKLEGCA